MNPDLTGEKALVCGSIQGLGLATAVELALPGAEVILMARNEKKLKEVAKSLDTGKGQNHEYIVADFQIPQTIKNAVDGYLAEKKLINIFVNNTGAAM